MVPPKNCQGPFNSFRLPSGRRVCDDEKRRVKFIPGRGKDRGRSYGDTETVGRPKVRSHQGTSRTQVAKVDHH